MSKRVNVKEDTYPRRVGVGVKPSPAKFVRFLEFLPVDRLKDESVFNPG
jgi:hypothetical protein